MARWAGAVTSVTLPRTLWSRRKQLKGVSETLSLQGLGGGEGRWLRPGAHPGRAWQLEENERAVLFIWCLSHPEKGAGKQLVEGVYGMYF